MLIHYIMVVTRFGKVPVLKIDEKGAPTVMDGLLLLNWLAFVFVTAYGVYLFVYVVRTRIQFIKLGKKKSLIAM